MVGWMFRGRDRQTDTQFIGPLEGQSTDRWTNLFIYGWMDRCKEGYTDGYMNGWKDGQMDAWMDLLVDGWRYR